MSCLKCGACCQYVTVLIPHGTGDPAWLLLHAGVQLTAHAAGDLVQIPARCTALTADNTCAIYADRPETCRRYRCSQNVVDDFAGLE